MACRGLPWGLRLQMTAGLPACLSVRQRKYWVSARSQSACRPPRSLASGQPVLSNYGRTVTAGAGRGGASHLASWECQASAVSSQLAVPKAVSEPLTRCYSHSFGPGCIEKWCTICTQLMCK